MAFQPGQSGNPGGRPKGEAKLREAARAHTDAALDVLVMALGDDDPRIRVLAANSLLDRGHGKPSQTVAGDPEAPLSMEIGWKRSP